MSALFGVARVFFRVRRNVPRKVRHGREDGGVGGVGRGRGGFRRRISRGGSVFLVWFC